MADIAVPKSSEPAEAVLSERVDEGRWESEGGQPVHKSTSEQLIEAAAKADTAAATATAASTTSTTTTAATASSTTTTTTAQFDAAKVHPKTIEGAAGDSTQSRYPNQPSSSSTTTTSSDESAAAAASESSPSSSEAASTEAAASAPPARKKSISERLAETWQDIKHKVEDLTHKK